MFPVKLKRREWLSNPEINFFRQKSFRYSGTFIFHSFTSVKQHEYPAGFLK